MCVGGQFPLFKANCSDPLAAQKLDTVLNCATPLPSCSVATHQLSLSFTELVQLPPKWPASSSLPT